MDGYVDPRSAPCNLLPPERAVLATTSVFLIHGVARPWHLRRRTRERIERAWMEPLADA